MMEEQIRSILRVKLLSVCMEKRAGFLLEEVGLRHGLARIDFLHVDGLLHGYEIKSNRDTLRRLPHQADVYSSVLDRVTLVTSEQHLTGALKIIPDWWGVHLVSKESECNVAFTEAKKGQTNPNVDKNAAVKLLWKAEALEVLEGLKAATGVRSKPRKMIYSRLAECATLPFIQAKILQYLTQRNVLQVARQ